MTKRDQNKCYISVHREGDAFVLRDQDGRKVSGVRAIDVRVSADDAVELTVTLMDAPLTCDGVGHIGRG